MGKKNNRICCICGKEYHFCPTCSEDYNKPTWYAIFDTERCHDIYEICTNYRDGIITIENAKERLSKFDLSDLENFAEATKNQIKEILSYKDETKPMDKLPKMANKNKATK